MGTRIEAPFATARKTAKVLGVSKSRFKALERLMRAKAILKAKDGNQRSSAARSTRTARTKPVSAKVRVMIARKPKAT